MLYAAIAACIVFTVLAILLLIRPANQQISPDNLHEQYAHATTFDNETPKVIPTYDGGTDMGMGYILDHKDPASGDTDIILINPETQETVDFTGEWEYVLTVATGGISSDNYKRDPNYILDYSKQYYSEYLYLDATGECYQKRVEDGEESEKIELTWTYVLRDGERVGIEFRKDGSPYLYILYFVKTTDNKTILFQSVDVTGGDIEKGENFYRTTEFRKY